MLNENETITLQWNNGNKFFFQRLGMRFTKIGDDFNVPIRMLSKNSKIRVEPTCDYCGELYSTEYNVYKRGHDIYPKDACVHCASKKTSELTERKRAEKAFRQVEKICKENGYVLLSDISEYVGMQKTYIRFLCPIHGEQKMLISNFLAGHKCIVCSYEQRGSEKKHDIQDVIDYIESINGNKLLNPEDYIDANTNNLKILCGECGEHIFITSYSNYRHQYRCAFCTKSMSNMEKSISDFLLSQDVNFIFQKTYDDCRDIKVLPFDFYLPKYNLIVEFDGKHHYFPIRGEEQLILTKKHDAIKNLYCIDNNIFLLRIPYYDAKNFKQYIGNMINEISKRNSLIS